MERANDLGGHGETVNKKEGILIVDDEAAIRKLLHKKLSREGYHCEETGSAE